MTELAAIRTVLECTRSNYWDDDDTLKEAWAEYDQAEVLAGALELIAYHEPQEDERAEAMRKIARSALGLEQPQNDERPAEADPSRPVAS